MLLTIIGVSLLGVIINIILKQVKPEIALLSSVVTCMIVVICVLDLIGGVITKIMAYVSGIGVESEIFSYLFKVLGISYVVEFMVDIAEESGSGSIANKVAFAGKALIASLSLPILFDLINLLIGIV